SRLVGQSGAVYAFEPCVDEAQYLLAHVRINSLKNVQVIQAAVSETSGLSGLTWDRSRTENSLCGRTNTLLIPTLSLDDAPLPVPHLIKMDIEGGEAAALRGAQQTLNLYRPILFVALHDDQQKRQCKHLLQQAGYRIYDMQGTSLSERPMSDEI